jgi:hypothetical protein
MVGLDKVTTVVAVEATTTYSMFVEVPNCKIAPAENAALIVVTVSLVVPTVAIPVPVPRVAACVEAPATALEHV